MCHLSKWYKYISLKKCVYFVEGFGLKLYLANSLDNINDEQTLIFLQRLWHPFIIESNN